MVFRIHSYSYLNREAKISLNINPAPMFAHTYCKYYEKITNQVHLPLQIVET